MKKTLKPGDTKFNPENLPPGSIYEANSTIRWKVDKDGKGFTCTSVKKHGIKLVRLGPKEPAKLESEKQFSKKFGQYFK
jgi:hypothetical protein